MASPPQQLHMTLAEFVKWDDGTDTLYELVDGRIIAMAPPRDAHGTIVMNPGLAIGPALKAPCRVVGNAGIVLPDRLGAPRQRRDNGPALGDLRQRIGRAIWRRRRWSTSLLAAP
jgi:Uma2 family endonuclease